MKPFKRSLFICFLTISFCFSITRLCAGSEEYPLRVTLLPAQYVFVKGDAEKFRALNWSSDGYIGGLKDLSMEYSFPNDTWVSFDGHVIQGENDIGGDLLLNKEDFGALRVDYNTYRKYYDGTGGYFHQFATLYANELENELHMDMKHVVVSFSPMMESLHDMVLKYEHHGKEGTKSRLTWTAVKEGSTTRNIGPVPQEVSETTDTISLEGKTSVAGFNVTGKQMFETVGISSFRLEKNLSTTSTAGDKKIRKHYQDPTADAMATMFMGEKWFNDDKSFMSMAYRFHKMDNDELENIIETNAAYVPTNFSSSKTRVNASAENELLAHTVLGHYMTNLSPAFSVSAKLKSEYINRDGTSTYPYDASPSSAGGSAPDGIIEAIDYSESRNKALNWGQTVGFRYTGIPKVSFYGDFEVGETKNNIKEQQHNISRVLQWERETDTSITKTIWTMGGRVVPVRSFNMTTQIRRRVEDNDYEDEADTAGAINSAFVDGLKLTSNEASTRLAWIPFEFIQAGFRYQLLDNDYTTRVQNQSALDSDMLSHIFTYDLIWTPFERLFLNVSYSMQDAKTTTPAGSQRSPQTPGFNADVNSVLMAANYAACETLNYNASMTYSWSDNFDNFASSGLPLGVTNSHYDIELGLQWKPKKKSVTLEPHYAYYSYDAGSVADYGDYSAHVAWLDLNIDW